MFCGLGEEECTKIRKKKKEKQEKKKEKEKEKKKLIVAKSGLVGMKEYLKTYRHTTSSVRRILKKGGGGGLETSENLRGT